MVGKLGLVVQAHMGSTRLKDKMLKDLYGKSVLERVLERLKRVGNADMLIVATSVLQADDVLAEECERCGVQIYRGSDDDVLERFYQAAKHYQLAHIGRVCADNTLLDWEIIGAEIDVYKTGQYDVVKSGETVPLGLGAEMFSFDLLRDAYENATEHYQHEHVTPYIYENTQNVYHYNLKQDYGRYRFTLDTQEDWELVSKIYGELLQKNEEFVLQDVIEAMNSHQDWFSINENVHQKTLAE